MSHQLRILAFGAALAATIVAGCGGEPTGTSQKGRPSATAPGGDNLSGTPTSDPGRDTLDLTRWVKDMVENQTKETNSPVDIDGKKLADSQNPNAYNGLFR